MEPPSSPFHLFPFLVTFNLPGTDQERALGGFTHMSGLGGTIILGEYRTRDRLQQPLNRIPGLGISDEVTFKRGLVDARAFSDWIAPAANPEEKSKRDVIITLRDEAGAPLQGWRLQAVRPKRYLGPALPGKGTDVVIEELVLSHEGIEACF